jgi:FkbM family methyltransferase
MKEKIQSLLAKYPALYKRLLLLKGARNPNLDKINFLSLIRDGDTVLDVGANVGYYTLLFSQIVGKVGEVHAFEPVPTTFTKLSNFIGLKAAYNNLRLNNVSIGESCTQKEIFIPSNDFGQASFAKRESIAKVSLTTESHVISQTTIDTYVKERKLGRLDFVKIDVEGYELKCLEGASETLTKFTPIIYLEIYNEWSKRFGYGPPDIVSFLEGLGYTEFYLVYDGVKRLNDATEQLQPQLFPHPANLICAIALKHSRQLSQLDLPKAPLHR